MPIFRLGSLDELSKGGINLQKLHGVDCHSALLAATILDHDFPRMGTSVGLDPDLRSPARDNSMNSAATKCSMNTKLDGLLD